MSARGAVGRDAASASAAAAAAAAAAARSLSAPSNVGPALVRVSGGQQRGEASKRAGSVVIALGAFS